MDQAAFLQGIAAAEAVQANELPRPPRDQRCSWCGNKRDGCSPIRVHDLLSSFHKATGVHRFIEPALKQLATKKRKHGVKDSDEITFRQLAQPPGLNEFGLPVLQDATFLQTVQCVHWWLLRASLAAVWLTATRCFNPPRGHVAFSAARTSCYTKLISRQCAAICCLIA